MNTTIPFIDKINAGLGVIVAVLSYALGEHWFLFVAFLGLNVIDYITGYMKSRAKRTLNSSKGLDGVVKKFGYWLMIVVAFGMSGIFIEVGEVIGLNLHFTTMIGWFVLASLIINEFRSIIENFFEMGYHVPEILTKGLEVANKALDAAEDTLDGDGHWNIQESRDDEE